MPGFMLDALALATAAALLTVAGLHVSWAAGGRWPGRDAVSLNALVVGSRPGTELRSMPPPLATAGVAVGLACIALGALAARDLIALPLPGTVRVLTWIAAGVLALRGIGGFLEPRLRPYTAALPYGKLNRRIYSPLCVALAAGLIAALAG